MCVISNKAPLHVAGPAQQRPGKARLHKQRAQTEHTHKHNSIQSEGAISAPAAHALRPKPALRTKQKHFMTHLTWSTEWKTHTGFAHTIMQIV